MTSRRLQLHPYSTSHEYCIMHMIFDRSHVTVRNVQARVVVASKTRCRLVLNKTITNCLTMSIQIMLVVIAKGFCSYHAQCHRAVRYLATSSEYHCKSLLDALFHTMGISRLVGLSMWAIIPAMYSWQTASIGLWSEKFDTQSTVDTSDTALAILLETSR